VDPLKDSREFGRRVSAARGYAQMKKTEFAKLMSSSVPTVTRWEAGDTGSIGTSRAVRQQLAERIQRQTKCPPSLFGVEAQPDMAALARATREMFLDPGSSAIDDFLVELGDQPAPTSPPAPEGQGQDQDE